MALWKIIKFLALVTIVVLGIELVSSEFNREWMILSWLLLSMSAYWFVNRVLHGIMHVAGETERDGVIWMLPLGLGLIPVATFHVLNDLTLRSWVVLGWGLLMAGIIHVFRPEIDGVPQYREAGGYSDTFRSLFKTRLSVMARSFLTSTSPSGRHRKPRLSASTFIIYLSFSLVAAGLLRANEILSKVGFLSADKIGQFLLAHCAATYAFLAMFAGGVYFTYNVDKRKTGWPIQSGEQQILVFVYAFCTFNIIVTSFCGLPLYWK